MEFVLGFVILILAFFLIGYFFKKKRYTDIDHLEEWKMQIMNRPVLEELLKVKQLNMTGETEKLFEKWRNDWDEIVAIQMPDVEELLFDAEECIDKFRFKQSSEIQKEIKDKLSKIEISIKKILDELNELVGSEEKNRLEIEELKESYRVAKKHLLAHGHNFGKAADRLERELESMLEYFKLFGDATESGNYLQAREYVLKIKTIVADVNEKMRLIPELLVECQSTLPSNIAELTEGVNEMVEKGYVLEHLDYPAIAIKMEQQIETYVDFLEKAEIVDVVKGVEEIRENISVLYDMLEKEVNSKLYINQAKNDIQENVSKVSFENEKLKAEISTIRNSYHITEEEIEIQRKLEKQIASINRQSEQLNANLENDQFSYSILAERMKELEQLLIDAKNEQTVFLQKLHDLRKDELESRGKMKELRTKLQQSAKWIKQYNVPGVPEDYKELISEAKEALDDVEEKLKETPLDMTSVQIFLEKAVSSTEKFEEMTKELIENMMLAEKVIQYANRYRSRYSGVQSVLQSAEEKFRKYEFAAALEEAAAVLEKIEPGILKEMKIELDYYQK